METVEDKQEISQQTLSWANGSRKFTENILFKC